MQLFTAEFCSFQLYFEDLLKKLLHGLCILKSCIINVASSLFVIRVNQFHPNHPCSCTVHYYYFTVFQS